MKKSVSRVAKFLALSLVPAFLCGLLASGACADDRRPPLSPNGKWDQNRPPAPPNGQWNQQRPPRRYDGIQNRYDKPMPPPPPNSDRYRKDKKKNKKWNGYGNYGNGYGNYPHHDEPYHSPRHY